MADDCMCWCGCDDAPVETAEQAQQQRASAAAAPPKKWTRPADEPSAPLITAPSNPILAQVTAWMLGFVGTYVVSNQAVGAGNGHVRWANITAPFPESVLRDGTTDRNAGVSVATGGGTAYGLYGLSRPVAGGYDLQLTARSWAVSTGGALSADSRVVPVRYAGQPTGQGAVEDASGRPRGWYQSVVSNTDLSFYGPGYADGHEGTDRYEAGAYHDFGGAAVRAEVYSWSEFVFRNVTDAYGYTKTTLLTETRRVVLSVAVMSTSGLVVTQENGSYLVPVNFNRVDPYRRTFVFTAEANRLVLRWLGGYLSISAAGQIAAAAAPVAGVTPYLRPVPALSTGAAVTARPAAAPVLALTLTAAKVSRTVDSNGGSAGTIVTVAEPRNVAAPSAVSSGWTWIDPGTLSVPGTATVAGDQLSLSWVRANLPNQTGGVGTGNAGWIDTPMHGTFVQASSSKPLFRPARAVLPAGPLSFQVAEAGWYALALMVEATSNGVRYYSLRWASAAGGGALQVRPPTDIYTAGFGPAPVYLLPGLRQITPPAGSFHSAALVGICPG